MAELPWSPSLAVNLFGELAHDLARADRAIHTWWPDAPGRVSEVRFYHSPGRFDPAYSNSLRSFDAMFVLDLDDGTHGAVAVDIKYREIANREGAKPSHLPRFTEIHDRSDAFAPGAVDVLSKSLLALMWLEHVLLLSMLQHASGRWTWGRYVVVHPEGNLDTVRCTNEYRRLLADDATFGSMTMEDLLAAKVLTQRTTAALRRRYIVS